MPSPASKPVIAVDIDDVIYPLVPNLIEYLDTEHKVKLTDQDFKDYDLKKVWAGGPIEAAKIFEGYKEKSGVHIAPLTGAREALQRLSQNYDIIVLTSRDVSNSDRTNSWIAHHFPETFKDVHLLGNKHDSPTFREKSEVSRELGVFCLIDDNLRHVLETNTAGIKTILFGDYPWNQANELPSGVTRVKNWQEVLEYLENESAR
jgi:uncharacterized HAD superfamily protein